MWVIQSPAKGFEEYRQVAFNKSLLSLLLEKLSKNVSAYRLTLPLSMSQVRLTERQKVECRSGELIDNASMTSVQLVQIRLNDSLQAVSATNTALGSIMIR